MVDQVLFREMQISDEEAVSSLIKKVFNSFVAQDFSNEGIMTFMNFIEPISIRERRETGNYIFLAVSERVLAVIEIRDKNHIALLFVEPDCHGRGIAKKLLDLAILHVEENNPEITHLSVNSSLYAVPIYEKLGFRATKSVQTSNGIIYVPMTKMLQA